MLLDCTSGDPASSRRIAQRLAEKDIAFADAPVSGGTNGAEAGTLTVMVGPMRAPYQRAVPSCRHSDSVSSTWGRLEPATP